MSRFRPRYLAGAVALITLAILAWNYTEAIKEKTQLNVKKY